MAFKTFEKMGENEDLLNKVLNYFALKDTVKELEEEIRLIEDNIIDEFGNGRGKNLGDFVIKLESKTSHKVDDEVLKEKYPEIYKRVCKKQVFRAIEIEEGYHGHIYTSSRKLLAGCFCTRFNSRGKILLYLFND